MANHSLPTLTSNYTNFIGEVGGRIDDAMRQNRSDAVTLTNPPPGTVRWNAGTSRWEQNTGTAGAPEWSALAAAYGIDITGSAYGLKARRYDWAGYETVNHVVGQLAWQHYGSGHTIFDASTGTSPNSTAIGNVNSAVPWSPTFPTLMGWNGTQTYGVRVDSARVADYATSAGNATTADSATNATNATNAGNASTVTNIPASQAAAVFTLPDIGPAAAYICLGTWTTGQQGHKLMIRLNTGQGYNADQSQNAHYILHFQTSNNGSSQAGSGGGFYGSGRAWKFGTVSAVSAFRIIQNSTGLFTVYANANSFSGVSTYEVSAPAGTTWANVGSIVAPSGNYIDVAISTVVDSLNYGSYAVPITGTSGAASMPTGTTAQRPGAAAGYLRFNTTLSKFEGFNGSAWASVGAGATGGSNDDIFYENGQTVTANYTITAGKNAMSAGPITIANGITVTVPYGSTWVIA